MFSLENAAKPAAAKTNRQRRMIGRRVKTKTSSALSISPYLMLLTRHDPGSSAPRRLLGKSPARGTGALHAPAVKAEAPRVIADRDWAHGPRVLVEALLDGLQNILMLPAGRCVAARRWYSVA